MGQQTGGRTRDAKVRASVVCSHRENNCKGNDMLDPVCKIGIIFEPFNTLAERKRANTV